MVISNNIGNDIVNGSVLERHNKLRVLILNDGSAYQNWGIKACIDGLKLILESNREAVELEGIPHDYMHRKYTIEPKILGFNLFNDNSRISRRLFRSYHELPKVADEFDHVADNWSNGCGGPGVDSFIKKAKNNDLIVFNAEGSTYRDNIGAIKGLFMLWYAKTRLKKRCYFMNGSVTLTLVDATLPAIVNRVFSAIDGVAVREPFSYNSILSFYPKQKMTIIPDSVFALDLASYKPSKNLELKFLNEPFFCFSLSMLPMDFKKTATKSSIVNLISSLKEIVPNAVLLAKDVEDQVLKDIANITDSYFVGPKFTYWDIAYILSRAEFLLSGRYHHLIFATKVGCPVIPLASSSHKIHGLSSLFNGSMPFPFDPTDLWNEQTQIYELAKSIVKDPDIRDIYRKKADQLAFKVFEQSKLLLQNTSL